VTALKESRIAAGVEPHRGVVTRTYRDASIRSDVDDVAPTRARTRFVGYGRS
jgi:hypothetical protein